MGRRIVDITDLVAWRGNLSGIQRVVHEMALRHWKEGAAFCYYIEQDACFYKVAAPATILVRCQPDRQQDTEGVRHRFRATHHLARRIFSVMTPPIFTKITKRMSRGLHKIAVQHRPQQHPLYDNDRPLTPTEGDTLIIYGAHWDKPRYIATVEALKRQYNMRVVHNINDFIPVYDRAHTAEVEHGRFPKYMQAVCEMSDALLFISEATRRDYERFVKDFAIKNKPVTGVMILGEDISEGVAERPDNITDAPFLLNVGTVEVRKNPVLIYQAYRLAAERGIDLPDIYIVGRQGWLSGDIYYQMIHDDCINNKIHLRHDIDDRGLQWLYQHCEFFVFPSYYEGWGLPIAEAAHHGKPSVASSTSSIPEVVGDGARYHSPYSADELLEAITEMLKCKSKQRFIDAIAKRRRVTWDDTFSQATQVIGQIDPAL